jgi:hypothetical protein
LARALEWEWV